MEDSVKKKQHRHRWPQSAMAPIVNPALEAILGRFKEERRAAHDSRGGQLRRLWPLFEESLGLLAPAIRSEEDFDAGTFLTQASWIRRELEARTGDARKDVDALCSVVPLFYRYVQGHLGRPVFAEGAVVTPFLLSCPMLSKFLRRGALFTVWEPGLEYIPGRDFYVITVHGMDGISTRMKVVDYLTVDLSSVKESYRSLLFSYVVSSPATVVRMHGSPSMKALCGFVDEFLALKAEPGYPNPDTKELTNAEMDHLRERILAAHGRSSSANTELYLFRNFVRWAIDTGVVRGSRSYLRRQRYARETDRGRQESIPASHFNLLMGRMAELAARDGLRACCYVALRMLTVTRMRVSALCGLRRDCLRQTADHGVWQVVGPSKTSGAGVERITVSDAERRAIISLSSITDPLRPLLEGRPEQDYLFIYRSRSGIRSLDSGTLSRIMRLACDDLGIPHYQPHHVRSCRHTRAARFAENHGLSKQDTALLTGHRNFDTTMNAYVSVSASDYYAALYGVMTEDVQTGVAGAVLEEMPAAVEPAAGEGAALGACARDGICTARTLLPCLTCRSFVTDVHHLHLFEQAVVDIDRRIMEATVDHDREDLVNIKEIYVVFIQKIKELLWKKETSCR